MKNSISKKIFTCLPVGTAFILLLSGMFSLPFVNAQSLSNVQTINPIIGDISFVIRLGYQPDATTDEDLRIKTHLEFVENLLRQKDVSNLSFEFQQKRTHLLDLLHDYWTRGKFPRNYDYKDQRIPCFIDKDNTICAVGYLVEQTAGRQAAEAINSKHKYDKVLEMNDVLVDSWIANSGLSKEECAMIQPSYCWCFPTCNGNQVYACRTSNCVQECKCVNANNVANWQTHGHPCRLGDQTSGNNEYSFSFYPNPVSNATTISFSLEQAQNASLKVFDMSGRLMTVIADASFGEGDNEIEWNVSGVNAGIYFLRMETATYSENQKLIVAK